MEWHTYVAYFFGGVFLVNSAPHFTNGVSGRRLPTPFASPLGKGQSSPTVNVVWGTLNLAIGYLLVCRVGDFNLHRTSEVLALGLGGLLMAVMLARLFGRLYGVSRAANCAGLVAAETSRSFALIAEIELADQCVAKSYCGFRRWLAVRRTKEHDRTRHTL